MQRHDDDDDEEFSDDIQEIILNHESKQCCFLFSKQLICSFNCLMPSNKVLIELGLRQQPRHSAN